MFWHAGFPLLVIAYTAFKEDGHGKRGRHGDHLVVLSVAAILVAACGVTLLATVGQNLLPTIMRGNHYTPAMVVVVSTVWSLSIAGLIAVWQRRPHSVLDLWLMVVLCAWIFDVALSAVLNAGRFDLGFYAGRIYGLLATGFVLVMLLIENSNLYSRLIETHESDRVKAAELQRLTTVDALTGIANRRAFEQALDQEWRRTLRHRTPLCLLMIDVDFFKRYNDAYGHVAGDHCLRSVAKVLAGNARRAGEVAARYGGEEFAVLIPHIDLVEAHRVAERICKEVRELNIPHETSGAASHVTISIGVASALLALDLETGGAPLSEHNTTAEKSRSAPTVLVKMADQALYVAKTAGRNRAHCARLSDVVPAPAERPAA
jgi:diguanylate cyclase (GGDEF)-like protein